MWVLDRQTLAFLAVNEAAIRHYGFSREEFLSMTIRDIAPEKNIPSHLLETAEIPIAAIKSGVCTLSRLKLIAGHLGSNRADGEEQVLSLIDSVAPVSSPAFLFSRLAVIFQLHFLEFSPAGVLLSFGGIRVLVSLQPEAEPV
jgi:hypothetical protein